VRASWPSTRRIGSMLCAGGAAACPKASFLLGSCGYATEKYAREQRISVGVTRTNLGLGAEPTIAGRTAPAPSGRSQRSSLLKSHCDQELSHYFQFSLLSLSSHMPIPSLSLGALPPRASAESAGGSNSDRSASEGSDAGSFSPSTSASGDEGLAAPRSVPTPTPPAVPRAPVIPSLAFGSSAAPASAAPAVPHLQLSSPEDSARRVLPPPPSPVPLRRSGPSRRTPLTPTRRVARARVLLGWQQQPCCSARWVCRIRRAVPL
jgi:hypothetical protein